MLSRDDISHLAALARISIPDAEKDAIAKDLDEILGYVSEVKQVTTDADAKPVPGSLRNVMRDDGEAATGGTYTDVILANMPRVEDGYLRVKQIF
jgi:aspartyl-tRNA(Asn)/glutamyl-tRNA(Gln) amidotransferase subunit C